MAVEMSLQIKAVNSGSEVGNVVVLLSTNVAVVENYSVRMVGSVMMLGQEYS